MKHRSKLSQNQEQTLEEQSRQQTSKEFASSDELLRFDAAQTPVPEEIARRLKKSTKEIPPPDSRPWWKKLFGR